MELDKKYLGIVKLAGIAAFVQIALILMGIVVIAVVGIRPESAEEAFNAYARHPFLLLLKDELLITVMLAMYFVTFSALFFILKDKQFTLTWFGVLMTFVGVTWCISNHSGFSLLHISRLYAKAGNPDLQTQLITAANTIISKNMWHSTGAYYSGIFLQGAGVMISFAMIGHGGFKKITIMAGVLGNGFDLIQHVIHPVIPEVSQVILMIAGPFYMIWYVVLGLDLLRIAKNGGYDGFINAREKRA